MEVSADGDGERRAYLQLMSLMAVAGSGGCGIEHVEVVASAEAEDDGGGGILVNCNGERSGDVKQLVGQGRGGRRCELVAAGSGCWKQVPGQMPERKSPGQFLHSHSL
jgi:hypothetical protein